MNDSMKTGNVFCATTKNSQILKLQRKMSWLKFSLLLGTHLGGKNPMKFCVKRYNEYL